MFPSPGDLRRPARLTESTLRSPRVSSLHNVIAERGCDGEGGGIKHRSAYLSRRISNRGFVVDEKVTLSYKRVTHKEGERKGG